MSHQDWDTVTFNKAKNEKKVQFNLPSKKEYTNTNKDLSLALQQARTSRGLTQKQLSNRLSIDCIDLAAWERGSRIPSNDMIAKLSRELGVKLPRNMRVLKEPE